MALVNWVYGANWTDRKLDTDFYLIKDGVIASGYSAVNVGADSYGTSDGLYYVASNDISTQGIYINVDFTDINELIFTAKHNIGGVSYFGRVGYSNASDIYSGVREYVDKTVLTEYTINTNGITGIHAFSIGAYNVSAGTNSITYVKDVILK